MWLSGFAVVVVVMVVAGVDGVGTGALEGLVILGHLVTRQCLLLLV